MSDIQKQINEALVRHAKNDLSYEWSENMKTIVYNHVDWLRHQQSIISQQAEEIERLKGIEEALIQFRNEAMVVGQCCAEEVYAWLESTTNFERSNPHVNP